MNISVINGILDVIVMVVMWLLAVAIYFLPTFCAIDRKHKEIDAIIVLNLLGGWTIIGWIVAVTWSYTTNVEN